MKQHEIEQLASAISREVGGDIYKFEIPLSKFKTKDFNENAVKDKIKSVVELYLQEFPEQSREFFDQVQRDRGAQFNEFGTAISDKGKELEMGIQLRSIYEPPELLASMIYNSLSENEKNWFRTKEGGRWFARTFPKFATSTI